MRAYFEGKLIIKVGDITAEECDAIVNAANSTLLGGGGVDGAIHRKGGKTILEECREIRRERFPRGLPTGQAVITNAGNLKTKFVIHTVGPVWGRQSDEISVSLLRDCYQNSLMLAQNENLQTLSFPAISTGIYGFPKDLAAQSVFETLKVWFTQFEVPLVTLVFFSDEDYEIFEKTVKAL